MADSTPTAAAAAAAAAPATAAVEVAAMDTETALAVPEAPAAAETDAGAEAEAEAEEDTTMDEAPAPAPSPQPQPPLSHAIPSVRPHDPLTHSYTYASHVPTNANLPQTSSSDAAAIKAVPCLMGIDEAGRGPVLGPMVYAVAYAPISYAHQLKSIGFADSKALTAERRDTLLRALIQNPDNIGWAVRVMSPQDISAGMLRRHPYNLNQQALDATVLLIQNVLDSGVDLTEIYVDTLGKAETHAKNLSSHFPRHAHIKWTVTSKADAIYPIVGAASIAAKVTRDRILEGWIYREPGLGKVLMLAPEKMGRGEHARGSTAGLLAGGQESEKRVLGVDTFDDEIEIVGGVLAAGVNVEVEGGEGEGDVSMDLDSSEDTSSTAQLPIQGPSAGAGKRKRTASTKLIELAEIEADQALKRILRKTALLRAAATRQSHQVQKTTSTATSTATTTKPSSLVWWAGEPDGLSQSPNPAFTNVGSGYPGDPNTVAFLKATLDPVFGWPGIARFSWGTVRTMLEPAKKGGAAGGRGGSSAGGRGKARGRGRGGRGGKGTSTAGRGLRSAGATEDDAEEEEEEEGEGDDLDGTASLFLTAPKQGYPIKWVDEQREAASAAVTSISKFFAPVAKPSASALQDVAAGGAGARAGAGDEGPLGRTTIARLENVELRKARAGMWREIGLAPVGSTALQL
ncbi:unnamed protein product [Tilletia caries]|uniref:Ribonuclease n=2 Tax=Tilletia TaxID=13289 RepID=A0A177V8W4_9BASI|nr:hypothetical protein CF336_g2999 [Tilletia laevis]KAE8255475.1 hypothetical protein A4X03_0g5558 [Tilletia caries]KAE8202064.1 hypothetical protein CF335_g3556 [Tilletia laevis]CAD6888014.1 unnamed protein product [Tilletia caries]CAD6903499.1 unnamed protein product [Tilletia caries]